MRRSLRRGVLPATFVAALCTFGPSAGAVDESFFVEKVYPVMFSVQCNRCHNDNGVGSETRLEFPRVDAGKEQITAFGLKLIDLVDRKHPERSILIQKPTNRDEHTGGERIKPGSDEEKTLMAWVEYLAGLSEAQVRQAREKIAQAEEVGLNALGVRRLTHSQYNNTVRDLLGDRSQPANNFPKEDFVNGFRNQVEVQGVSPLQAEAYGEAAERLAISAFRGGDSHHLVPGEPASATDPALAGKFIGQFGLKAFRRPLTERETNAYAKIFAKEATRTNEFYGGAKVVVEAMLQSPYFLFRVEQGSRGPFEQFEIASRLSYFLWDTMPSEELLRAAASGELSSRDRIEATVRKMLEDPRAKTSMEEFLAQWLRFDNVLGTTRDRRRFRDFNTEVAAGMVEETRRLFDHLVWQDRNFMEFFTADYTFVSSDLARLYGLPVPEEEYARVSYPADSGRSGVLGHGTYLVQTSKPSETSPTSRGLFVRNHFLGHEIPPPPPGVNTVLPENTEDKPMTNRQRLDLHLNSQACSTCHRLIDPIGLGFEQYNAIGAFQEKMQLQFGGGRGNDPNAAAPKMVSLELDTSSHIQGIEKSNFTTPKELGKILAESKTAQRCIAKQLFRYTFGREETAHDQPVIDAVLEKFQASGFRFRELIVAMATSDLFLQKGAR